MAEIRCKIMTMDERKKVVARLVDQFKENEKFYTSKDFVESETRNKFIDPLLEALAWDVKNEKGARHDKQEVITEDRVVIAGQVKHPDYTLCYGGERKIYVEAKQPSVDLKSNPEPALQVRRYAYTSKMPIAILTDFQEFAIYDTRIKPKTNDTAATARIEYLTYNQYVEHFEELFNRISWEAVDLGKFETYWETSRDKKGTATVDSDILQMIEKWRVLLAEDIALHNDELDEFNLTSSVQKIIDRILFLRICEDKEIEERGILKKIADAKPGVYDALKKLFSYANEKFNAGLFATDAYLDSLVVQDKTLAAIINALYFPECQYEFSVLPVEILGSIYERFLGKIIRFTRKTKSGHSVEIIEKPEVQKAGGVYYTPPYIVRYIVKQTIGKKIKDKTPEQITKMYFVDPACGSGSFLVGAYQYLLDWHLNYYLGNIEKYEKAGKIYKDAITKEYKLSIEEKKSILLNNIYGVDIDAQAVEVTKLSLFLKLLENEGRSLSNTGQAQLFRTSDIQSKILPSMKNNIKCGNSLIGSDYYADKDLTLFDMKAQRKVNVFDWEKEFPQVFNDKQADLFAANATHFKKRKPFIASDKLQSGLSKSNCLNSGFDCVIGNPPYVNAQNQVAMPHLADQREWLLQSGKYKSLYQKWDLYVPFIEKGLQLLTDGGLYSAIVPYPLTNQSYAKVLREIILRDYNLIELVDLNGTKVFATATVSNCIPVIAKEKPKGTIRISHIDQTQNISVAFEMTSGELVQDEKTSVWNVTQEKCNVNRHADMHVLGDYCYISKGMVLNSDENDKKDKFVKADLISEAQDEIHCRKYIEAKDIEKYHVNRIRYLEYGTTRVPQRLSRPTFPELYNRKKILTNKIGALQCIIDDDNVLCDQTNRICILWKDLIGVENKSIANSVKKYSSMSREEMEKCSESIDLRYMLAIMNSKYANILLDAIRGSGNIDVNPEYIRNIPIPSASPEQQSHLATLADQMIATKKQLSTAKSEVDHKMLEQRVQILDSQINTEVYKLYGLTEDEIKVVEGR